MNLQLIRAPHDGWLDEDEFWNEVFDLGKLSLQSFLQFAGIAMGRPSVEERQLVPFVNQQRDRVSRKRNSVGGDEPVAGQERGDEKKRKVDEEWEDEEIHIVIDIMHDDYKD